MRRFVRIFFFGVVPMILIGAGNAKAQCELFDFYGNPSSSPYWYSCSGGDFTLNLQSPHAIGEWTVDWGDGSAVESGSELVPPNAISHVYAATVDTFEVVFTEVNTGCTVSGVVVIEEATSASIQIPVGGLTQACAPQTMEFINSSTNTSETTTFTWDFGDGSPNAVFDHTNWGQTISHTYQKGTVDCETVVTLTAENYCNQVQGGYSQATFNPIRIWDIDDAGITASEMVLCWPENEVTFTNTTERNCLLQGNIYQRYEYWNFGDYWGLGYDSIIDWRAWPPTFPHTLEYPGIGTYSVTLLDSNLCGIDVTSITVEIVPPPTADASADETEVCEHEVITFTNSSSSNATHFEWDFGDGTPPVYSGDATVQHVYGTAGNYSVMLVAGVGGLGGCADTTYIPITVVPGPEAEILLDRGEDCDQLEVQFSDGSSGTISDWSWDFGNGNTSNLADPPLQNYGSVGAYNVTLTVEAPNGCRNTDTEIVYVHETPVSDFLIQNVCVGSEGSFTDVSTSAGGDPIVDWFWDFGDGTSSTQSDPEHSYSSAGTYTVSLTVGTAHCSHTSSQVVTVEPAPEASFVSNIDEGCDPLEVEFTGTTVGGDNYVWIFGDGGSSALENPTHVFNNYGSVDSVYTVAMIAKTAFGCADTAFSTVTVRPNAQAHFDAFYVPSCEPDPAIFINNSVNADSYEWHFGDGSPVETTEDATHEYVNNGQTLQNYTVTLVATTAYGCNDTSSATITVFPQPSFDFTLDVDSGCSPLGVQFPVVPGAVSYQWSFGDGTLSTAPNPYHSYGNSGNVPVDYEVRLVATSPFGCNDTATANVVVYPDPVPQFTVDKTSGCGPLEVVIENQSLYADSVVWNYGDGTTSGTSALVHSHTFTNNTNQTQSYTIELTAYTDAGCSATYSRTIEVHPVVTAAFDHPEESCSPISFVFDNQSENADFYHWELGNGTVSVAEEPLAGYQNNTIFPDTFDIRLVATSAFGCEDTAYSSIVLHPKPSAAVVRDVTAGCSPLTVTFQNNSTTADRYEWYYGDGTLSDTSATVHQHVFHSTSTAPQVFQGMMIASSDFGCRDTTEFQVTVYPEVNAGFVPSAEGCSPLPVDFFNTSQGAATYAWSFGDGNEAFIEDPSYTFVNTSDTIRDFRVSMVAQSGFGCTDTTQRIVTVHPNPNVSFVVAGIEGCHPADFSFANYTGNATSYHWDYGDGTTSDNGDSLHTHTYTNNTGEVQNHTVTLTATSDYGCEASNSIDIEVIPEIVAGVNPPLGGCSPYTAEFENVSTGAYSYFWDFGDGTVSEEVNPTHVYINPSVEDSVYTVLFIARSLWGCADTLTFEVPVHGQPQANFLAMPAVQQYPNATVDLVNLSVANSSAQHHWNWGDGNVTASNNPDNPQSYTYGHWGEFDIVLTVGSEVCNDTSTQKVVIKPPLPIADFIGEGEGCQPLRVSFENRSTYGLTFHWDFGDGTVSDVENPTHVYYEPGVYNVALTVTGPGGDQDVEVHTGAVVVHPRAEAYFTVNPPVIKVPDQVYFLNMSTDASIYHWDFGDGQTSTAFSPYHFYESLGWHSVTLVANNEWNCPDTFRVDQAVKGNIDSRISFPNAFTPNTSGSTGGYWSVDDMFSNDIFFPLYKGVDEFQMQIFNKWGELLFESTDVRQGWDGYYRGELCQQDVYVWRVKVKFLDGSELTDSGDVTLLR